MEQMSLNLLTLVRDAVKIKNLNEKAMTVRLTRSKPRLSMRDKQAEDVARSECADESITAYTQLFRDPGNPVRELLSLVDAVYAYHKTNTLPYVDRGPRLLPVERYDEYRDAMRTMIGVVETKKNEVLSNYGGHVDRDIWFRNSKAVAAGKVGRAQLSDYQHVDAFRDGISIRFAFAPLPDYAHAVFDVSEEDREDMAAVIDAAMTDLYSRLMDPLRELVDTLSDPTKIFRDTKVSNVVNAVANVRSLAMGDENVLKVCNMVEEAVLPYAVRPDTLRESPIVRGEACSKLADVANKMAAFM